MPKVKIQLTYSFTVFNYKELTSKQEIINLFANDLLLLTKNKVEEAMELQTFAKTHLLPHYSPDSNESDIQEYPNED